MKKFLKFLEDVLFTLPLLILGNSLLLWKIPATTGTKIIILMILMIYYLFVLFFPERKQAGSRKLAILSHGIRLIWQGCIYSVLQIFVISFTLSQKDYWTAGINFLISLVILAGIFSGGIFRTVISSRQVKVLWYVSLFFFWWVPVGNLILFHHIGKIARREFYLERAKAELDLVRKENEICRTKYPVLMVHGIFFRDWQMFDYWGRIPPELRRNGAEIYYGKQQSSQSIAASAEEVHHQIHAILEKTGAEKINIIAHSKGGLDSRYAIAKLGDAPYVASLTTISTPHHGCDWVDTVLKKIPVSVQQWIDRRYRKIFQALGDTSPEFLAGVYDLTAEHSKIFNKECPVPEEIFCQCYMSEMRSANSAPFPLKFSYLCVKLFGKEPENDGLVPISSAKLEQREFYLLKPSGKRGISHGDMIDLNRENISDFDVREFYVNLLKELKQKGF